MYTILKHYVITDMKLTLAGPVICAEFKSKVTTAHKGAHCIGTDLMTIIYTFTLIHI